MLETFGRYEALHLIASGGMASVYLGRARGAGGFERLVALKVMHPHIAGDPAIGGMFLDEARLAARIRHPNVVPTLDVADDGRFLVMEYVEGASLHAILQRLAKDGRKRLPLPIALRIFLDSLAGLHAAHELCDHDGKSLNIVHRDVSPHNILVGVDGTSRITDFGIAYAEARITSTRSGQLKGKLPYMAPEQLEDRPVDRRTDVYAAGCVLWEILTGKRLFRGGNEAAVACAVLAGPERTVAEVRPDVPASISEACMVALARRDQRHASALQFAEALEQAAEAAGLRIAKHRDVGPVAAATNLTFPAPRSMIAPPPASPTPSHLAAPPPASEVDEPPTQRPARTPALARPAVDLTAVSASGAETPAPAAATSAADEPAAEEPVAEEPVEEAPPTLQTPSTPTSLPATSLPEGARTTAEDRPPPEVAAVIRAAYAHVDGVERASSSPLDASAAPHSSKDEPTSRGGDGVASRGQPPPSSEPARSRPASSSPRQDEDDPVTTHGSLVAPVARPRRVALGTLAVVSLLAGGLAAALWMGGNFGEPGEPGLRDTAASPTANATRAARTSASAVSSEASAAGTARPDESAATSASGAPSSTGPASAKPTSAPPATTQPLASPPPTRPWPTAAPPPPTAIPTPPPRPSGYHPAAP